MIYCVGICHDVQFDRQVTGFVDLDRENTKGFETWLTTKIQFYNCAIVGEEIGPGEKFDELLSFNNSKETVLQKVAKKINIQKHFTFDISLAELNKFLRDKPEHSISTFKQCQLVSKTYSKSLTLRRLREKIFISKIQANVINGNNALVVVGSDHLSNIVRGLLKLGNEIICYDYTLSPTYKNQKERMKIVKEEEERFDQRFIKK